jgi:hypothetical protein
LAQLERRVAIRKAENVLIKFKDSLHDGLTGRLPRTRPTHVCLPPHGTIVRHPVNCLSRFKRQKISRITLELEEIQSTIELWRRPAIFRQGFRRFQVEDRPGWCKSGLTPTAFFAERA